MLHEQFVSDMKALPRDAVLVPLGDTVLEVISHLKEQGLFPQDLMSFEGKYVAPPHPSGANAESIALLLEPNYPTEDEYTDHMYRDYLFRKPWVKKNGQPQPEAKYKAVRTARWKSMQFVRRAYRL